MKLTSKVYRWETDAVTQPQVPGY